MAIHSHTKVYTFSDQQFIRCMYVDGKTLLRIAVICIIRARPTKKNAYMILKAYIVNRQVIL